MSAATTERSAGSGSPAEPRLTTLPACLAFFGRKPTPRLIAAYGLAALGLRVALGGWGWRDAIPLLVILALEPFTEWAIHVVILHWKPRRVLGRQVDLFTARKHRIHHANPRDLDNLFVPMHVLLIVVPVLIGLGFVVMPARVAATTAFGAMAMLLTYEWTHFLIHSPYQPRHRYYRSIWRAHRLHHYRNERYWFGVTVTLGDKVLRTFPAKGDVEMSPTVRTLGVDGGV